MYYNHKINELAYKLRDRMLYDGEDYREAVNGMLVKDYDRKYALNHEKEIMDRIFEMMS